VSASTARGVFPSFIILSNPFSLKLKYLTVVSSSTETHPENKYLQEFFFSMHIDIEEGSLHENRKIEIAIKNGNIRNFSSGGKIDTDQYDIVLRSASAFL
jgi:hypothetical protein